MRKTLKIIGIYLFLIVANQSCSPDHYFISDIEFSGATISERNKEREKNHFTETDVLKNDIIFIIRNKIDYITSLDLGISSKCYAFSKGEVIDNHILESTYSLKFDHSFKYKNLTVDANTNLFEIDELKNQIEIYNGYGADKVFEFSQEFKTESVFTSDDYEVTFNCSTSDNRHFEKKIIVKIEN
jgi:hypothetical protein|nr:hypothetical protein [uncultured Flavobacterium sp.]